MLIKQSTNFSYGVFLNSSSALIINKWSTPNSSNLFSLSYSLIRTPSLSFRVLSKVNRPKDLFGVLDLANEISWACPICIPSKSPRTRDKFDILIENSFILSR